MANSIREEAFKIIRARGVRILGSRKKGFTLSPKHPLHTDDQRHDWRELVGPNYRYFIEQQATQVVSYYTPTADHGYSLLGGWEAQLSLHRFPEKWNKDAEFLAQIMLSLACEYPGPYSFNIDRDIGWKDLIAKFSPDATAKKLFTQGFPGGIQYLVSLSEGDDSPYHCCAIRASCWLIWDYMA